jgi:hypothetical protein
MQERAGRVDSQPCQEWLEHTAGEPGCDHVGPGPDHVVPAIPEPMHQPVVGVDDTKAGGVHDPDAVVRPFEDVARLDREEAIRCGIGVPARTPVDEPEHLPVAVALRPIGLLGGCLVLPCS